MRKAVHLFGRAVRETGQAVDRLGLTVSGSESFKETFSRHRPVMNLYDKKPVIAEGVFIAPNSSVVGEVLVLNHASIWYGAVVRGDSNKITIGTQSNVQDRAVINTIAVSSTGFPSEVDIGDNVTIGHGALLTSCTVGNNSLIGQGAIIEEGTVIESNVIIAAGAVVLKGSLIPQGQLWAGNPAKYIRDVTEDEISNFEKSATAYAELGRQHAEEFLPFGTVYQQAEQH